MKIPPNVKKKQINKQTMTVRKWQNYLANIRMCKILSSLYIYTYIHIYIFLYIYIYIYIYIYAYIWTQVKFTKQRKERSAFKQLLEILLINSIEHLNDQLHKSEVALIATTLLNTKKNILEKIVAFFLCSDIYVRLSPQVVC